MSLFEVYDPFTFFFNTSVNWLLFLFFGLFCSCGFWLVPGNFNFFFLYNTLLISEFKNFFFYFKMKSLLLFLVSLFSLILFSNFLGLFPYVFSSTSHFVFSISVAFPFWLGLILMGWLNFSNSMFSHLIPLGTPFLLISFMVLIETVSNFIRPWSVSVRLMANMISGHLLLSLLGGCDFFFFGGQVLLFVFEFFVCFIQAYVFCALLSLYSSEI